MYLKTKWIPLNAVLSDVYQMIDNTYVSEDNLIEWAAKAMEEVTTFKMWEHALCIVPVSNYKALLPTGMQELDFVMYNKFSKCSYYVETLEKDCTTCTPTDPTFPYVLVKEKIGSFTKCRECQKGWAFLSMSYSALDMLGARFQVCDDSPSLHCSCEDAFSINYGCATLTTTFSEGTLLIAYKQFPMDEQGNFLIPDIAAIRTAIETYVYMKYWQKRSFADAQGAITNYERYLRQWELLSTKAILTQMLPDEMGYIKMTKHNKFLHHDSPWAALSNMGREKFNQF